jgi:hypothetical protein
VTAGVRAQFKRLCAINRAAEYGFLLVAATDGQVNGRPGHP